MRIDWKSVLAKSILWTAVMVVVEMLFFGVGIVFALLLKGSHLQLYPLNALVLGIAPLMWLLGIGWIIWAEHRGF